MEQMSRIREQAILRVRNNPGRRPGLTGTAVPRFFMEHQLKAYLLAEPMVHKKPPLTPDRRQALKEKVFNWLKGRTIRKVQHPKWITNAILIKLASSAWQVKMDYSGLNKICAKDMYPFLEIEEELESLMGYPYKYSLEDNSSSKRLKTQESYVRTKKKPPAQPRVVYAPILNINYFRHFLDILENYNPTDNEPIWAVDRVVAPTLGSTITIPETANEFAINAMSSASSTITYTSVYTDSEPGRVFWGDDEELSDNKSPGYVAESDPEEDLEEYEDDETEDGLVDYPMDGGDDGDDDDGDSSGDDADDEDE
nr:hypothetical protein [Tanacetum cinerariifolium]